MKIPEAIKKRFTLKRWIGFIAWCVLITIPVLPATTQSRYGAEPLTTAPIAILIIVVLGCGIFIPGDLGGNPIKKGEGKQTILFFLIGYSLTWLWFIFLLADIHYSLENGVSWRLTWEGVCFGGIGSFFTGWLLPVTCFGFKSCRWKLAWALMFLIFAGGILYVALRENQPGRIYRSRFGQFGANVQLESMTVTPCYESSYEAYKLSGDTAKIQVALQRLFQGEKQDLTSAFKRLPNFMRPAHVVEPPAGWNFSIYVWTWTDGQYLYVWFNTWEYHALKEWEAMLRTTQPEAKK